MAASATSESLVGQGVGRSGDGGALQHQKVEQNIDF